MPRTILITGVPGFIGSELLRYGRAVSADDQIYVVLRPGNGHTAKQRLDKLVADWQKFFALPPNFQDNIHLIEGDLCALKKLPLDHVDVFFHAAASTDMSLDLETSRLANLNPTIKALQLARQLHKMGRFVFISTAYVAGRCNGTIHESHRPSRFWNHYERSKYEAEQAVRLSGLPFAILRPSIVVGDSRHGYFRKQKVLYSVWRAWLSGRVPRAPIYRSGKVDCVPIDYVVRSTWALAANPQTIGKTLHQVAGDGYMNSWRALKEASEVFKRPAGKTVPPWLAMFLSTPLGLKLVGHGLREILQIFRVHLPYLGTPNRVFSDAQTRDLLASSGIVCPAAHTYSRTLFEFCRETHWGKRGKLLEGYDVFRRDS